MTLLAPPGEWPNGPVEVSRRDLDVAAVWFPSYADPYWFHVKAYNDQRGARCMAAGPLRQSPALTAARVHELGGNCCSDCVGIVRRNDPPRPAPSGVLPFADDGQAAADRALVDRLAASDEAGNLTSHRPDDACSLGLWHEGPCPDRRLERQLQIDDRAEDRGMPADERATCGVHRGWLDACIGDPSHANRVTRYNWCHIHDGPVQRCKCWTANLSGDPLPGDEPAPDFEGWVDWLADPRVHSDGIPDRDGRIGLSADTRHGIVRVLPHPDGMWRVEGPYGNLRYTDTRHEGMMIAVGGELHPDAVRRPPARPAPSGVIPFDVDEPPMSPEENRDNQQHWSPDEVPLHSIPLQRGRAPRMTYSAGWFTTQGVAIGSRARDEHYWKCPKKGCPVWAGPYDNAIMAKSAGMEHVDGPAHRTAVRA